MADLLATQAGMKTLERVACFLSRKFASRNMERAFWIAFEGWRNTGYFDKSVMLHELNPLVQDDIEALDSLLASLGCLDVINTNLNIYVDPVNGSDLTGDGSADYPYASFDFLKCFTRKIAANVRVLLVNDLDMGTDVLNLNFNICGEGCFSIIGVGAPTVIAGPYVSTAGFNLGTIPVNDYGHVLTFAETFVADEFYGKWLRFENGGNSGEAYPIFDNTDHDIDIRGGIEADLIVGGGDQISIIEPSRTLKCQTINIEINGTKNVRPAIFECSRFNFLNLNIDITGIYNHSQNFVLNSNLESQISFCTLISDSTQSDPIILESNLNQYRSADPDVSLYATTGIHNLDGAATQGSPCGLTHYDPDLLPATYTYTSMIFRHAESILCVQTRGLLIIDRANISVEMCGAGIVRCDGGSSIVYNRIIMYVGAGYRAISTIYIDCLVAKNILFTDGGLHILWLNRGFVHVFPDTFTVGSAFTGYFAYYNIGGISQVLTNSNPSAMGLSASAIWFPAGTGATAFPANDSFAESTGSYRFSIIVTP